MSGEVEGLRDSIACLGWLYGSGGRELSRDVRCLLTPDLTYYTKL